MYFGKQWLSLGALPTPSLLRLSLVTTHVLLPVFLQQIHMNVYLTRGLPQLFLTAVGTAMDQTAGFLWHVQIRESVEWFGPKTEGSKT